MRASGGRTSRFAAELGPVAAAMDFVRTRFAQWRVYRAGEEGRANPVPRPDFWLMYIGDVQAYIRTMKTISLDGLVVQLDRVFVVYEPSSPSATGGIVAVGELSAADQPLVLHGAIPARTAQTLGPLLLAEFRRRDQIESKMAALESALMATGGEPLADQFEQLGEQCEFEDSVDGPCPNKPTKVIRLRAQVCDLHSETDEFPQHV